MNTSFWFDSINLGWSIVYIEGSKIIIPNKIVLLSPNVFDLANSVDPDEMLHFAAFHLGLRYLPKYTFRSHLYMHIIQRDKRLIFSLV